MTERKAHITRIYKDDDPESGQWIDVERLDELSYESGSGYQYRKKRWIFHWDDFNPDGNDVTKKQILDPNDETGETYIEVPVRGSVTVHGARGEQYQGNKHYFLNDDRNRSRKTRSRRVYHHDISDIYLDGNGQPPSDPAEYRAALGAQDKAQYVEVELLDRYWSKQNENRDPQGKVKPSTWQEKKWLPTQDDPLLQDPILDTDEIDSDFVPVNNPNDGPIVDPPWRLDPLQNIVNVSWGGGEEQAVISIEKSGSITLYTVTGVELGSGQTAASGAGVTVISDGYVAYGNGRFVASHNVSNEVSIGTFDGEGGINWVDGVTVTGIIKAISFCGGLFFISSRQTLSGGNYILTISSSPDAEEWESTTVMSGCYDIGNVACKEAEPNIYCCVGPGPGVPDQYSNLYSVTSSDGISWGGGNTGIPAGGANQYVSYGNGRFETGSFEFSLVTAGTSVLGTGKAAVASSSNGATWTKVNLGGIPGGTSDNASFGQSAVFVRDKGGGGYFIETATVSGPSAPTPSVVAFKDGTVIFSWGNTATDYATLGALSIVSKNASTIINF